MLVARISGSSPWSCGKGRLLRSLDAMPLRCDAAVPPRLLGSSFLPVDIRGAVA